MLLTKMRLSMKYILLVAVLLSSGVFASEFDETMDRAMQGSAWAQFSVGLMYATCKRVPENDAK